ncbi:HAMP domain-containing histidine kinase, partial [Microbacterium lushaniae]
DASVESFRPAADSRRVRVIVDAPPSLEVRGDAFRLRQAVDNVLSNAIKYTPGGGSVHIGARAEAGHAVIVVADTGIGIAADELPRVFDPYFRARTARESSTPGTGLGMGILRTIIEEHRGTLQLESEQGTGTTVTITLPAERGA